MHRQARPRCTLAAIAGAMVLTACGTGGSTDATHLTIMTTGANLDTAVSHAVAQYVTDEHGATVELRQHDDPDAVYDAVQEATADADADQLVVGVVTEHQEPGSETAALRVPDELVVVAQAPAELGFVPATSTVTAARFAQQQTPNAEQPVASACAEQTWLHANLPDAEAMAQSLAESGCQPTVNALDEDFDTSAQVGQRLTTEHDTVALLYGVDPIIVDYGLTTLDLATDDWPHGNVIVVGDDEASEDPMTEQLNSVLEVLDSEAATAILRGYDNAQTSTSDLVYDQQHAVRYWLATHGLADPDTVTQISTADD